MKKYLWMFVFLCISFSSFSATSKTYEVSQEELIQISHEVSETLFEENTEMWKHLFIGTLAVETNLGQFKGNSPYGVAQMRNSGFQFVQNELKKRGEEYERFEDLAGETAKNIKLSMLEKNHRLAIIYMAYYYKFLIEEKEELDSIERAAKIWKKYYNTKLGKGNPKDFIKAYEKQKKYIDNLEMKRLNSSGETHETEVETF